MYNPRNLHMGDGAAWRSPLSWDRCQCTSCFKGRSGDKTFFGDLTLRKDISPEEMSVQSQTSVKVSISRKCT